MHNKKSKIITLIIIFIISIFVFAKISFFSFLFQLIFNRDINLKLANGSVNILLLGIGGGSHDGPDLTDTIIFASLNLDKNSVTLVSIPRDLWITDLNQKINTAYAIGQSKRSGGGLILAEKVVSKILNQPINYGIRLNFQGFVQAVDLVGGLDINVDRTFDDYQYPIDGKENDPCGKNSDELQKIATESADLQVQDLPCRYEHLHFDKGLNHMNGKTALEYVRSRHAIGDEGTDFARSARQEKVIKAFKDKILSPQTIFNPAKFIGLYAILKSNIDTDIKQDEFDDFVRLVQKLRNAHITSAVLDYGNINRPGLLSNPPTDSNYNFEWVLTPRVGNGNFTEIQKYVDCEIRIGVCPISSKY